MGKRAREKKKLYKEEKGIDCYAATATTTAYIAIHRTGEVDHYTTHSLDILFYICQSPYFQGSMTTPKIVWQANNGRVLA